MSLAAIAVLLAVAAGVARAGDDPGEADKRKRAGKHVEEGDRFKEAGDYEAAAREYEKAYELVPHPELFFNLAQVYRLGGKKEKALEYYERYLAVEPNGRAAAQARRFARQLKKALDRAKGKEHPPAGSESGSGSGSETGSASGSGSGSGSGAGTDGEVTRGVEPQHPGRTLRIAGMATAGAGVIALAVGVKYGLDARRISHELSDYDEMWTNAELARQAVGKRAEKRMFIGTGVGAALIAGGAVLYYLGHSARAQAEEAEEGVTAAPLVSGDTLGFALSGHF
jgi:tetratricopeptide (TPR) repeat protein